MDKTEKCITKRSPNWEQEEKDLLLKLILEKLDIIENPNLDTNTNKMKKGAWQTVYTLFNITSSTTERTLDQIQSQWRKIKNVAKSKQVGDSEDEMELITRLSAKHFDPDYNSNNSVLSTNELCAQLETSEIIIKQEVEAILDNQDNGEEAQHVYYDVRDALGEVLAPALKRPKPDEEDNVESAKRKRLLELEILQKESDIKYAKMEFDKKIQVHELQMQHMKVEHKLRMEKLKIELDMLKNKGG